MADATNLKLLNVQRISDVVEINSLPALVGLTKETAQWCQILSYSPLRECQRLLKFRSDFYFVL